MNELVFDTYSLIEIAKGNPSFDAYLQKTPVINHFILAELCYWLLREHGKEKAFSQTDAYEKQVGAIDGEIIKKAAQLRLAHKKQKLSYTDCVSYAQSQKMGIKFLTGDRQFEALPNVEFVK